ncbi:porin family protein [Rickettsiella endosymbiont of Aleochara curtula]|uniref:porin family protein n=1 Tax=Rickettsiella endosymbiont of Aleochara curtula TaxID=3077936 RepID=UPI00313C7C70
MLKKLLITSVLTASACAVMNANAALPVGLYVSGQAGYADTHMKSRLSSQTGIALANDGLAGRIALGYKVTPNFGLELGYLQLSEGKSKSSADTTLYNKQHAIDVAAKGMLPITSNVNIYGKIGVAYLTTELKEDTGPISIDRNQTEGIAKHKWAPEVAIGMGYDITPNVTVDTSLTHIQPMGSNRPGNIDFLAVGIGYNFG